MRVKDVFAFHFFVTYCAPKYYEQSLNPAVMKSNLKEVEKSALVIRLERNQNDLRQLKSKLNSYTCEPKTYSLFERIETLRNGLENLSESNTQIIRSLKSRKRSIETYFDSAKEQLTKFNQLQQGIDDYVASARNC